MISIILICLIGGILPLPAEEIYGENDLLIPPRVLIFNGLPGDDSHHIFYEKILASVRKTLESRFRIPRQNIAIFYGPKDSGYDGPATRENVLAALSEVVDASAANKSGAVWLIFQGHANRIPGGANFNLPGPDLSARDLARALKGFPKHKQLVIVATTTAGSDFLKQLGAPGRIILAATVPRDPISETEFPQAFAAALAAQETDRDNDGAVTALELFQSTKQRVITLYEAEGFMIREHAQLDGNGDGKGTQRPADVDAQPAAKVAFRIPQNSRFD